MKGCLDRQSVAYGKVIAGIAERADRKGVPVCALVGSMRPGAEAFLEGAPSHSVMTTVNGVMLWRRPWTRQRRYIAALPSACSALLRMGMQCRKENL